MSDLELLFLVLAAIYGWECACWLRRGSVAFITWFGNDWQIQHPGTLAGNAAGGFVFAPPLPPLGCVVTGNLFPLSLSPDAALAFVSPSVNPGWRPAQTGKLFRWDGIQSIDAKGKKVLVNAGLAVKTSSPTAARNLVRLLRELQGAPTAAAREKRLQEIQRQAFDTKVIEQRWKEFRKLSRPVQWLANVLFVYLFVLAPIAIWKLGIMHTWLPLLGGLLTLTALTSFFFRRAHKTFYPEADEERFTHFLTVLFSPATAIRAHDILSRPLLEAFHPLAIATVFCPREELERFAIDVLRELRHPGLPLHPANEPESAAVEQFSRAASLKTVETFLAQHKFDPAKLLPVPEPADATSRAYCPRCHAQYTAVDMKCEDCGGLDLIPFRREPAGKQVK